MPVCDVCGGWPAVAHDHVRHLPNKAWYCQACLDAGAEPWEILAWYRALLREMAVGGGLAEGPALARSLRKLASVVYATCQRLGRTHEAFEVAVDEWTDPASALCAIHGYEPVPANSYLICYECQHAFATEDELVAAHQQVLAGMGLPAEESVTGRDIDVCPLCTHSF